MSIKSYPHITLYTSRLNKVIVCLTFIFCLLNITTAQQFNNWYFGRENGITFNTILPSFLQGSQIGTALASGQFTFSCASISDKNGNLLFSSDGMRVWDKNNILMPNGFGLRGEYCQINGTLIVPFINDVNKYYLFTSYGLSFNPLNTDTIFYRYSVIDMQANGGKGDVIVKNKIIRSAAAEKMVAIPHVNGTDIWWVCRDWTNHFYSYKIDCNGLDTSKYVMSTIGDNVNNEQNKLIGDIKASSDGKFICAVYSRYFEVYSFNNVTGKLVNSIKIPTPSGAYGVEFSPNSKLLYVSIFEYPRDGITTTAYQFNLSIFDSAVITNTAVQLQPTGSTINGMTGGLQLGPDGKIYHCNSGVPFIDRIEFPNIIGIGCMVTEKYLIMLNPNQRRFPYSFVNLITAQNVQIPSYTVAPDCRTATLTGKTYIKGNNLTFKWQFGDGDSLVQVVASQGDTSFATVTHFYPPGIDTFFASLTVTSDTVCGLGSADKAIVVRPPKPKANFGIATVCNSLQVQFTDSSLLNFNPSISYNWQFGNGQTSTQANNAPINFTSFGNYTTSLIVTSPLSCVPRDTLTKVFTVSANPKANFTVSNSNCINQPVLFTSAIAISGTDSIQQYFWRSGNTNLPPSNTATITYNTGGTKTLQHWVITKNGCQSDTAIQSFFIEAPPTVSFTATKACVNEPVQFTFTGAASFGSINSVQWQLGNTVTSNSTNPVTTYNNFGNYTIQLKASTAKGCADSLSQTITITPIIANAGKDTAVFANQPFVISGSGGNNYNWQPAFLLNNNRVPNPTVRLQQTQQFTLTVSNNQQCTSTDIVLVTVLQPLQIPNIFSPNGDGTNDVWVIKNLADYSSSQLQIFNRYGQVVYSTNNYQNNFNGTINGKPLPIGTYYYILTVNVLSYKLPPYSGSVTIVR